MLANTKDPEILIREEPWIISDICGEENLSIVDVGIKFGAFSNRASVYPATATNRTQGPREFPEPGEWYYGNVS